MGPGRRHVAGCSRRHRRAGRRAAGRVDATTWPPAPSSSSNAGAASMSRATSSATWCAAPTHRCTSSRRRRPANAPAAWSGSPPRRASTRHGSSSAISTENRTWRVAQTATHLAVHLFGRERIDVDRRCSAARPATTSTSSPTVRWSEGPGGVPVLDGAAAWFVGRIIERFDLGDHVGHLLEPVTGGHVDGAGPGGRPWATPTTSSPATPPDAASCHHRGERAATRPAWPGR